ncbi:MAG: hypothetical protein NVSMB10_17990 [Steroidobacteraceae bacterium]
MPSLCVVQLALFLSLLAAAAAVHKALRWTRSRAVVRMFAGVPDGLAGSALAGAIGAEAIGAACLATPTHRIAGALLCASLWGVYLALLARAIGEDRRDIDCGCTFGSTGHRLGAYPLARNVVLVTLALLVAAGSIVNDAVSATAAQGLGAAVLVMLYVALDQVLSFAPARAGAAA